MYKFLLVLIITIVVGGLGSVHAIDGFAVWSKGGGCERELHFSSITDDTKVGDPKLIIKKAKGADIWPVISADGKWIAWSRGDMSKKWKHQYGQCDYHDFGNWDLYIAKIDGGKILPATHVKKIANGYLPSWGDDSDKPTKTLYFTKYGDQTIQKTMVSADGSFTAPVQHSKCKKKMSGSNAHTQGSPDGKYIAYRPGGIKVQSVASNSDVKGMGGSGCHPHWGPRSKYLIWAQNHACRLNDDGKSGKGMGSAGVGKYFHGLSNDSYFDEGKLWVIGRIKGSGQNGAGSVEFREVDISNNGWKLGKSVKVGSGSACDIHMWGAGGSTQPVLPMAPTDLKTMIVGNGIKLTWKASKTPAATYNIYRDIAKIGTATTNEYMDNTAVSGKKYKFAVSAFNNDGESAKTGEIEIDFVSIGQVNQSSNSSNFSAKLSSGATGLKLVIEFMGKAHSVELYDARGVQKAFLNVSNTQTTMKLNNISDGQYVIKLNTANGSIQKSIRIAR